jgi:hypothetical protein
MRRWIVLEQDEQGSFFPHIPNQGFDNSVFMSMPHRDTLMEILNKAASVQIFALYTGDGDPALCQGAPLALCNGGGGPNHAYSSVSGSNQHIYAAPTDVTILTTNAGPVLSHLLNGFLDKDSNPAPPCFAESFQKPDKNGG